MLAGVESALRIINPKFCLCFIGATCAMLRREINIELWIYAPAR